MMPLPESNELIWWSERSGWGHLYLYDLNTGKLKHPITGGESSADGGEWLVRDILHYDTTRRELLLQTTARDPNINPYYRDICKINIDSCLLTPLVAGNFDHHVSNKNNFSVRVLQVSHINHLEDSCTDDNFEERVLTKGRRSLCIKHLVLV